MYNTPQHLSTSAPQHLSTSAPQHQSVFPQQIRYDIYMKMI